MYVVSPMGKQQTHIYDSVGRRAIRVSNGQVNVTIQLKTDRV